MSNRKTGIGIFFILLGTVVLVLLFLWLSGYRFEVLNLSDWFSTTEPKNERLWQRPEIVVPQTTGSSELEDFYARQPKAVKRSAEPEEIDTSLWSTDYYTSPEGVAWKKDSNSDKVMSETKTGEQEYKPSTPSPLPAEASQPQQSLHVEFWESPINYKGYKLEDKMLIVFGISPDAPLRFENHTDGIWMHYNGKVFLLKSGAGYMPFVERGAELSAQDSILAVKAGQAAEQNIKK